MATLSLILRRARTLLWTALSILIIFAAFLVGMGKLLMPYSERYQPSLETWLSREFGQKVTVESFDGEWNAFGPRLSLRGLRLQPLSGAAGEVAIARAAVDLKPLNVFIPGRALYNFLVIGADLRLVRTRQGQYALSGFGVGGKGKGQEVSGLRKLVGIGELILENSSLEYIDEKRDVRLNLTAIDARLKLDDEFVSMKIEARLSDEGTGRVYGEVDASGLLKLAKNSGLQEAHWQVTVRELLLASLQGRLPVNSLLPQEGRVNAEFWCDWSAQSQLQAKGVVDLRSGLLLLDGQQTPVEHLNTRLAWKFHNKGNWRLDLDELLYDDGVESWTAPSIALARDLDKDIGLWISAEDLPLNVPLKLARNIMASHGTAWPRYLPRSASGNVGGLELVLDRKWRLQLARGTAHLASISDWGKWPGLRGVDAEIDLERGFGTISLHASRLDVQWPQMFRDPLAFTFPGCDLDLAWGDRWQVVFHGCSLMNDDLALMGDVLLAGNEGRPAVDVNVEIIRGQMGQLAPYWPQGIMSKNVLNWLRRGLLGGEITGGRVQIVGDMDDWPFRQNKGRFEAVTAISGAELDYLAGWPQAQGVDATARFAGASMSVEGAIGNIAGAEVRLATADIADFKAPLLQLRYDAQSTLDTLIGFIVQSPLERRLNADLSRFGFSGPADTSGSLQIPLGATAGELVVDGQVALRGDRFIEPNSAVVLDAIEGAIQYSQKGLKGSGLRAQFKNRPARLSLAGDRNAEDRFRADVSGFFDVQDVMPDFLLESHTELKRMQGEADWRVSVVIPAVPAGQDSRAELVMRSDLIGVAIDLPDPLRKSAGESWPLELHYPLNGLSGLLDLKLGDRMQLRLDTPPTLKNGSGKAVIGRALVRLGDGVTILPTDLPQPGLIRIGGAADSLDLDGWVDLITARVHEGRGLPSLQLERCEVTAGQMRFLDRLFSDVGIELSISQGDIKATFSAADINGQVVFNPASGASGSLSAEFERLVMVKPVSGGVDMKSNPGELPALHLYARSFQYAGIEMGETRIEAYPTSAGFHFEKVESESDHLSVRASGDWLRVDNGQRSDFSILVTAESLGQLLHSMGFGPSLEGGQTMLHFDAWWPGSPAAFALSRLNGELEFSVSQGQITNAGSGTGRILGLLSIQALPRRLALDFRDVFDSGFVFEEAKGTFHMENGMAGTDDVVLSSSAARITLSGSTDLVAQQYDQVMTIQPGLGNTLPVIGALAGGPGGAAAGLALQGLLQKQLGHASQVRYTITGSWDQPLIEPILKDKTGG
jgi:uncharacterized protein (TIGR02099 family)